MSSPTKPASRASATRRVEHVGLQHVLAADVDERAVGARRVGGDHDPLDQHVRVLLHQFAVLEGARLGLVGVAHEVLVHRALRQERDLLAHLEARAAAPAQARGFELCEHLVGRHRQRLAQRRVAAARFVHRRSVASPGSSMSLNSSSGRAHRAVRSSHGVLGELLRVGVRVGDEAAWRAACRAAPGARRGRRRAAAGRRRASAGRRRRRRRRPSARCRTRRGTRTRAR